MTAELSRSMTEELRTASRDDIWVEEVRRKNVAANMQGLRFIVKRESSAPMSHSNMPPWGNASAACAVPATRAANEDS